MRQTFEQFIATNFPTAAKADIGYIRIGWDQREAQMQREINELVNSPLLAVAEPSRDPASRTRAGDNDNLPVTPMPELVGFTHDPVPLVEEPVVTVFADGVAIDAGFSSDEGIPGSDDLGAADAAAKAE